MTNLEDEMRDARPGEPVRGLDAIEGSDASGTVYCVVDLTGAVVQVGITDGWWEEVGAHGVAPAVLQALQLAREKAGIAKLMLARYGRPLPSPSPAVSHAEPEPEYAGPEYDDQAGRAEAARRKIDRAAASLAESSRFLRAVNSGERRQVVGPRGLFRVHVEGLRVVGASVNEHGLRADDAAALADDAREALLAVRGRLADHGER
ncbi:hypothetical protein [Actinoplanes sp. NPDC049681]|uniref:hypothetical protein n=1 Tax=Actinoplanes sp. NPDC049681 TaxID=3363905 RepID=UPI0037963EB0